MISYPQTQPGQGLLSEQPSAPHSYLQAAGHLQTSAEQTYLLKGKCMLTCPVRRHFAKVTCTNKVLQNTSVTISTRTETQMQNRARKAFMQWVKLIFSSKPLAAHFQSSPLSKGRPSNQVQILGCSETRMSRNQRTSHALAAPRKVKVKSLRPT